MVEQRNLLLLLFFECIQYEILIMNIWWQLTLADDCCFQFFFFLLFVTVVQCTPWWRWTFWIRTGNIWQNIFGFVSVLHIKINMLINNNLNWKMLVIAAPPRWFRIARLKFFSVWILWIVFFPAMCKWSI